MVLSSRSLRLSSSFPLNKLVHAHPGEPGYEAARNFSAQKYRYHFGCSVDEFMPHSLSLYDEAGLTACIGYRSAGAEDLFLEQYLDEPIQKLLAEQLDREVDRRAIVEIGCLAVRSAEHALALMVHLAPLFYELGFEFAACTATRQIRCLFKKLSISTHILSAASKEQLGSASSNWGGYFDNSPLVMAGDIKQTISGWKSAAGVEINA